MQVQLITVVSITVICCSKRKQSKKSNQKKNKNKYVVAKEAGSFDLATKPVKLVKL